MFANEMGENFQFKSSDPKDILNTIWYPDERIYSAQQGWWMQPLVPACGVVFYLLGKAILPGICRGFFKTTGKSPLFFVFILLHNSLLLVFSAAVWYQSWQVVNDALQTNSDPLNVYCDSLRNNGAMWKAGMGRLAFLFYMSKYYEFIDTFILIVKQKKVSYLQSYHHAGAVLVMWYLVYTQATSVLFFVCLNSMIHTFMYFYYLVSACGIRLPGKSSITTAQIIQFIVGLACTTPMFFMEGCQTKDQLYALFSVHAYVYPLIGLFANFYIRSYIKSGKPTEKKTK